MMQQIANITKCGVPILCKNSYNNIPQKIRTNKQKIKFYKRRRIRNTMRAHETLNCRFAIFFKTISKIAILNHVSMVGMVYILLAYTTIKKGDPKEKHLKLYNIELFIGRIYILWIVYDILKG